MGAVLSQEGDTTTPSLAKFKKPVTHPVAFFSATFTPTERNYDIYERELLAMMKALAHWRPYLGWTKFPFTIMTDHMNLQYWKSPKNLNRRMARWHADLQEYDYEILYIPAKTNTPPDVLKCNSAETSCALHIWRCTPEMETLSRKHMNNPYGHMDILYGSMQVMSRLLHVYKDRCFTAE